MTETASGSVSDRVAADLRSRILAGELEPGQRIRQEDVAEGFGSSRLPVREALRILAAEGLVELETNKGARIPSLDADELSILYKMRERLEPLALSESLPSLEARDIARLREIQTRIASESDLTEFLTLDREFHMMTYSGCTSDHLLASVHRFWNSTQHYRRAFMQVAGAHRRALVNAEHDLLLDAIERGDSEDAERYLAGHIRRTRIELVRLFETLG